MNLIHFYKDIIIIIISFNISMLHADIHKPAGREEKIKLNINGRDRTYYELDSDGLFYKNIGQKYKIGDSLRIGFYSRTIKAPTGKKSRNYGFSIEINDGVKKELRYKKSGSKVTSSDRPGWNYTESGIWYVYLPVVENGYKILVKPLKGNPVVYIRVASKELIKEGIYSQGIKTVNRQDRWQIKTKTNKEKEPDVAITYWYPLLKNNELQYEITGPKSIRAFSRLQFENDQLNKDYYIHVKEDGYDLGTYFFNSEVSELSYLPKNNKSVGKWRSIWINVPKGRHYYTFTLPNVESNLDNSVYIRIKEWKEK